MIQISTETQMSYDRAMRLAPVVLENGVRRCLTDDYLVLRVQEGHTGTLTTQMMRHSLWPVSAVWEPTDGGQTLYWRRFKQGELMPCSKPVYEQGWEASE